MNSSPQVRLIQFLKAELRIPEAAIDTALRQHRAPCGPLPMVLWQYGFITLEQLDRIFDWLETA